MHHALLCYLAGSAHHPDGVKQPAKSAAPRTHPGATQIGPADPGIKVSLMGSPSSGDNQVDTLPDEPETEDQAAHDDHLVGVGVHPGPGLGQERLAAAGPKASVDLQGQVGRRGQDAEQASAR